jgi:dTDP-4-amino-4,6-dideoxygalactose transaminase
MFRIGEEEVEEVRKVIASGKLFRLGDAASGHQGAVDRFEREWAETIGAKYSLCLSGGGTAALVCCLAALGIGPGDEVLVPGYTWMATATAALTVGAIPVICEVDETLALDPDDVERKITPQTKAMIPVYMVGRNADLERLLEIGKRRGVYVVEDASQADGGSYRGRRLGSWGEMGAFSFNDFKIMSCGEGGALVTSDLTLYDRARIYHDSLLSFPTFGQEFSVPTFVGAQLRASEVMGAILRAQLRRLDGILADLRRNARRLIAGVEGTGLRVLPSHDPEGDCHVVVAFRFGTEAEARRFAGSEGVHGGLPIDTGRHVYSNWDSVLEHRIGHHPAMNPYEFPQNRGLRTQYSKCMCPRTLDLLGRTVYLNVNPDWTEAEADRRIEACRTATRSL